MSPPIALVAICVEVAASPPARPRQVPARLQEVARSSRRASTELGDAFEVGLRYGLLVHLRRYLHDGFARVFGYRIDDGHAAALRAADVKVP